MSSTAHATPEHKTSPPHAHITVNARRSPRASVSLEVTALREELTPAAARRLAAQLSCAASRSERPQPGLR